MNFGLEELDVQPTRLGELILRRRQSPSHGGEWVYEVLLGGEFLMSSAVHAAEVALATEALAGLTGPLRVLVGGLGLGHTAAAALDHPGVERVDVVELLPAVVAWHEAGRVPLGRRLSGDSRCHLVQGDFFARLAADVDQPYHAILLDIDHSPAQLLHPRHADFYEGTGPGRLAGWLTDDGVFALWSADAPGPGFLERLRSAFRDVECRVVPFDVPHLDRKDVNTLVLARERRT